MRELLISEKRINFETFQVKHGTIKSTVYLFNKTAYISDCNDLSIIKINKLKKLNYLILDCLKIKKNWAHFNVKDSVYIHENLKPKKTFLTNLHNDLDYNYLKRNLPKNMYPAYDGLKLNL